MITINAVFDAYININITMILVFGIWFIARMLLRPMGLFYAYATQLKLLYGVVFAVAISPVFVIVYSQLSKYGVFDSEFTVNLSDFVVAQYLQGNFEIKPALLEEYLGMRSQLTVDAIGLNGNFGIIVAGIIASGFLLYSVRLLNSIFALRKIVQQAHVCRRFGNLKILLSDTTPVPFSTRTLNHRYVVLPSHMVTNVRDIRIAIAHEFQHMRQYDLEWEMVLEILRPVFFWNPAFYLWKRQIEQLRELSCDQNVVARKGYDLKEYCDCLLRVCQNSLEKSHMAATAIPKVSLVEIERNIFGRSSATLLRQRVNSLFDGNVERYPKAIFLGLLIPLMIMIVLSTLAIQKPDDWSQDRIMLSTIINLERLAERNSLAINY